MREFPSKFSKIFLNFSYSSRIKKVFLILMPIKRFSVFHSNNNFFNVHLFHLCSCHICSCVVIWYPFSFLVCQYFSWESFGLNALVVLHIRIQTRRLQGWLVQSYVIFGHHQALRLVIFCSLQYLRRMTPFCNSCACNQSQINVSRILPVLLKLQFVRRGGGQRMGSFCNIYQFGMHCRIWSKF